MTFTQLQIIEALERLGGFRETAEIAIELEGSLESVVFRRVAFTNVEITLTTSRGRASPGCDSDHLVRMKLHYGGTPQRHPDHAFAERGVEFASTSDGRLTFRVGKKAAGRLLDGREWNELPRIAA